MKRSPPTYPNIFELTGIKTDDDAVNVFLKDQPYVVTVGSYGHAVLYNTRLVLHFPQEGEFNFRIIPERPGEVNLNFIVLFINARKLLNAPLFQVIHDGRSLWNTLEISPRLTKTLLPVRFWYSKLLVYIFEYTIVDGKATLTVIYDSSALVAGFINETASSSSRREDGRYVTSFSLPAQTPTPSRDVDGLCANLDRLSGVFLTAEFGRDVSERLGEVVLEDSKGPVRSFDAIEDFFAQLYIARGKRVRIQPEAAEVHGRASAQ